MKLLFTLAAFVLALGSLIIFHELGHYWVARFFNVKVLRFSLGFGKPLWVKKRGTDQTEWAIGAFPLGGYVKMLDEREGEVGSHELHRAFNRQSVYRRIAIVLAGPLANLILALLLYWALFMYGVPGMKPVLGVIPVKTATAFAGFNKGELILKIDQETVATWQDVRWVMLQSGFQDKVVTVEVQNEHGDIAFRHLDLKGISADDPNEDFLDKLGLTHFQPELLSRIGQITSDGSAARAGLASDDEIVSINHQAVTHWEELVKWVRENPGVPLQFEVKRHDRIFNVTVTPDAVKIKGEEIGRIGAGPWLEPGLMEKLMTEVQYSPLRAFQEAGRKTWETSVFSLKMLGQMISGVVSWRNISGPITIADFAGQTAQMGLVPYLSFIALISISLGVLNLLPIPLLDGGHLLYYMVEMLKGSPVSERVMLIGQQIGMAILLTLMTFAFYNDVNRLLTGS